MSSEVFCAVPFNLVLALLMSMSTHPQQSRISLATSWMQFMSERSRRTSFGVNVYKRSNTVLTDHFSRQIYISTFNLKFLFLKDFYKHFRGGECIISNHPVLCTIKNLLDGIDTKQILDCHESKAKQNGKHLCGCH